MTPGAKTPVNPQIEILSAEGDFLFLRFRENDNKNRRVKKLERPSVTFCRAEDLSGHPRLHAGSISTVYSEMF